MKLKLYNNCGKTVKSVYFNAGCFDSELNLCVQLRNIPYINVDAKPNAVFGNSQTVEVPDITCSVFVEVSKILFDDGSIWINSEQKLDNDIVTEDALGEDWLRLRLTKAIKDTKEKNGTEKSECQPCYSHKLTFARSLLMMEQSHSSKAHSHSMFISCFNNLIISYRAAGLCHIFYTAFMGSVNVISKWEESIRA